MIKQYFYAITGAHISTNKLEDRLYFHCEIKKTFRHLGLSYTIPDSHRSDINLRCFPVLSAITTFYI